MKKTLYMDIADRIAVYIKQNRLQPGDKLPTYRELGNLFGTSVHTIGSALERLSHKGLVEIRPQSGIFVQEEAWKSLYPDHFNWQGYFHKSDKVRVDVLRRFFESRQQYEPSEKRYVISNLSLAPEYGWFNLWMNACRKTIDTIQPNDATIISSDKIQHISGVLADHLSYHGLEISPDNILLTRDTNYSLLMIALTFFSPGTVCYYVSPSMLDVAGFAELTGFLKVPLPAGAEGIDLEYFSERIKKGEKAFLVISPELSLSGRTVSLKKRRALYNLCHANDIPIVELDEYGEYRSVSTPPIAALDKHGIVFYVGTFVHTLGGSAEVGWIAAAPELIERLHYMYLSMWVGQDSIMLSSLADIMQDGSYRRYLVDLRHKFREKEDLLFRLLDEHLNDIATWDKTANVFFWIKFHKYIDAVKIAENQEGLTLTESSQYAFAEKNSICLILMGISTDDLPKAIERLSYLARKAIKK